MNKQNMHSCAQPHEHQYHRVSAEKVAVCCALGNNGIITLSWFEDAHGHPETVSSEHHI